MKPLFPLVSLFLLGSSAFAQPAETETVATPHDHNVGVEPQTPEMAVRNFASLLGISDLWNLQTFIRSPRVGFYRGARDWLEIKKGLKQNMLVIESVEAETQTLQNASVRVSYYFQEPLFRSALQNETLQLVRANPRQRWQFAPQEIQIPSDNPQNFFFRFSIALISQHEHLIKTPVSRTQMDSANALSNLKQINLALIQYVQDYDEKFAFDPAFVREALAPYIRTEEIFRVSGAASLFSFNENLAERSQVELDNPVTFYDGANGNLHFRFDGRAAVVLLDGTTKLVSPGEAKTLDFGPRKEP